MKGKILGSRYKVIEYIAKGGFGKTYLAEDTQLPGKNKCVVKQLYPSGEDLKLLAVARRLFYTEASTLHILGHHEQIPKLLAYFEEEEKFYLVQQYIKGQTLAQKLTTAQAWTETQVIELLKDGLNVLQFIHSQGVIHRDVKPDNLIRRDSDNKLILVDFGTVKAVLQGQANANQLTVAVGTQGYMPIEQARGKPLPASDLYALGVIGIQALTKIVPIDLEDDEEGELIWESLANVSPQLAQVLTQMTRYQPDERYQSATEVLQALDTLYNVEVENQSIAANENINLETSEAVQTPNIIASPAVEKFQPSVSNTLNTNENMGQNTGYNVVALDNKLALIKVNPVFTQSHRLLRPKRTEPSYEVCSTGERACPHLTPATQLRAAVTVGQLKSQLNAKKPKYRNISSLEIASLAIAITTLIIGSIYILLQQPNAEYKGNSPANSNGPSLSTPRMNQGEGFRKGF